MPYGDSNLSPKLFYASIASEILGVSTTKSEKPPFIKTTCMHKQGCKREHLKKVLINMHDRHVTYFKTFFFIEEKLQNLFSKSLV